jgi:regulator of protease activity HflC (stomatin/prohibitin superfamily)
MPKTTFQDTNGVAVASFLLCVAVGIIAGIAIQRPWPIIAGVLVGVYLLYAIKVVRQWERVALLRLGHYVGLRGPGLFFIVPVFETLSPFVDQRVRVANVTAESTLTRDTVPVDVDAIVFWLVWNAEKAILEVENYLDAIALSAQTALRESIGRHELAQMITDPRGAGSRTTTHPRCQNESLGNHRAILSIEKGAKSTWNLAKGSRTWFVRGDRKN